MFNKPTMPPLPLPTEADSGRAASVIKPEAGSDIFVMPEKFQAEPVKNSANKPLIIAGTILVAVAVLVGAYLIYDFSAQRQLARQQAAQNAVLTPPVVDEVNEALTEPEAAEPELATTTESESATSTDGQAATSTDNLSTTTESALTPPAVSRDSDSDGLTDIEEDVIGTSPVKPDTDVDGYKDSDELLSGYNPLSDGSQGKARLADSDFISLSRSSFSQNNFSFLYPRRFKVSFVPESGQAIISADTGEIIRISSQPNERKISSMNWYLQSHPQVGVSQLKTISTSQLSGFFTPDGLTAYLTDAAKERIYSFEYLANPQTEFRYPTIFSLIIKNFQIVIPTTTPATATTTPAAGQ